MKYFAIFFISFFLVLPAYAAKTVKGTVPQLQPLQPPAAGINPNLNGNVQYRDPGRPLDSQPQDAGQAVNPEAAAGANPVGGANQAPKKFYALVWVVFIAAALGLGYWLVRRGK